MLSIRDLYDFSKYERDENLCEEDQREEIEDELVSEMINLSELNGEFARSILLSIDKIAGWEIIDNGDSCDIEHEVADELSSSKILEYKDLRYCDEYDFKELLEEKCRERITAQLNKALGQPDYDEDNYYAESNGYY